MDNIFGEVGRYVAAAGTKRGAAVLARAPSTSWAVSTLWPSSAGSHRRALAEAHRMLKVLLRCNAHGQCGVDGRVRISFLAISKTSLVWTRICAKMLVSVGQGV